jgi:lysophospholipase L1-like esterase
MPEPLRAGQFARRARDFARRARDIGLIAVVVSPAVIAVAGVALLIAYAGPANVAHAPVAHASAVASASGSLAAGSALAALPRPGAARAGAGAAGAAVGLRAGPRAPGAPPAGSSPTTAAVSNLRTSCHEVVHIGDSTSEGMVSPAYLPSPAQRLTAQYQDVGVQTVRTNIVGANSVVETLPGDTNGYNAARDIDAGGYHGCWVLALGTNDTADVAIGSDVSRLGRIQEMMSAAHGQPVLWVNVVSILNSGPYSEANMQQWNAALQQACSRYKNMRIFNWASLVQPSWFVSDGIHYTPAGYAVRAQQIAQALAKAFPAKGHSNGCTVS